MRRFFGFAAEARRDTHVDHGISHDDFFFDDDTAAILQLTRPVTSTELFIDGRQTTVSTA
jgi:hypothetical protein